MYAAPVPGRLMMTSCQLAARRQHGITAPRRQHGSTAKTGLARRCAGDVQLFGCPADAHDAADAGG